MVKEIQISYDTGWDLTKFSKQGWSLFLKLHFQDQVFETSELSTEYSLASVAIGKLSPIVEHLHPNDEEIKTNRPADFLKALAGYTPTVKALSKPTRYLVLVAHPLPPAPKTPAKRFVHPSEIL